MNTKYSIKVECSPAYELLVSFYVYSYHRNIKWTDLGTAWKEETRRRLPAAYARQLEDERWEVLHRMVLLISQCPHKQSVEGFLAWLEQLPPGEIYERLVPWVRSIPLDLGDIRDRSLYLLSEWNQHYFRHLPAELLSRLEQEAVRTTALVQEQQPIDLVEQLTDGMRIEPVAELRQVILIPQYHCAPSTILDFFRGMATCLYPISPEPLHDPVGELLPLAQCLADEKRLRILHFLAEKPRTLIEIHQQVGLAKSTVHHHITSLRRAGMIRSHYVGDTTPAYYSLREQFVETVYAGLRRLVNRQVSTGE
ncbi:winged helix-turn-helix domain-containing protein [Brevibacillus humidisoli]|uniref:ArsR/SmtB family transcription factor n=1 Tax=Brevibacillus humidisoli TaxID=2895522 RepID=UPI001E4883EA|nr:winged helix-turn-helix domain-containing protein [Brevibacillus humidisoli]UFJ42012.1 winged helix-turn-helix domain-containing protein [Brevibacillus humidisoli]